MKQAAFLLVLFALFPSASYSEVIDVMIKGVDDGLRTSRQKDYDEALMNAKLQAIERSGVEISSITRIVNFEMKYKVVESKAAAVLLPGFQILDIGYQTDGSYQIVLAGKVQLGGSGALGAKMRRAQIAEAKAEQSADAGNCEIAIDYCRKAIYEYKKITQEFPDSEETLEIVKGRYIEKIQSKIDDLNARIRQRVREKERSKREEALRIEKEKKKRRTRILGTALNAETELVFETLWRGEVCASYIGLSDTIIFVHCTAKRSPDNWIKSMADKRAKEQALQEHHDLKVAYSELSDKLKRSGKFDTLRELIPDLKIERTQLLSFCKEKLKIIKTWKSDSFSYQESSKGKTNLWCKYCNRQHTVNDAEFVTATVEGVLTYHVKLEATVGDIFNLLKRKE